MLVNEPAASAPSEGRDGSQAKSWTCEGAPYPSDSDPQQKTRSTEQQSHLQLLLGRQLLIYCEIFLLSLPSPSYS